MADRPVSFPEAQARRIAAATIAYEKDPYRQRGRHYKPPLDNDVGGFGNYVIRFQIQTMTSATRVALCQVTSVPYGMTRAELPGIDEALSTDLITFVDVADPTGCYFNEPAGGMVGRNGWAMYMQPQVEDVCNPSEYGILLPQWEVFSVCCGPAVCGDLG